jgi:hypothetical protein
MHSRHTDANAACQVHLGSATHICTCHQLMVVAHIFMNRSYISMEWFNERRKSSSWTITKSRNPWY